MQIELVRSVKTWEIIITIGNKIFNWQKTRILNMISLFKANMEKRKLLEKTKITKQTWSIVEIFQKIKDGKLIVDTDYQRNAIWDADKKTAFVESLFMEIMIPPIYVVEIPGEDFCRKTNMKLLMESKD